MNRKILIQIAALTLTPITILCFQNCTSHGFLGTADSSSFASSVIGEIPEIPLADPIEAGATVYYISDCQPGAAAECVPGDDHNPGTSKAAPWKTVAKAESVIETVPVGTHFLFARGGSFLAAHLNIYNANSKAAHPIVFGSYAPTWGAGLVRPIITIGPDGVSGSLVSFSESGNADHDEGYVFRNIELRGTGYGLSAGHKGTGIFIYNDADYITVDNMLISGFQIGVDCSTSNAPNAGSNALNEFITIKQSRFINNDAQGTLFHCSDGLIENNFYSGNGYRRPSLDHNLYVSGGDRITVRGNKLINNGQNDRTTMACSSVSFVVHGLIHDMVIENNYLEEKLATASCYGITVDAINNNMGLDGFVNVIVRGNKVINMGGVAIGMLGCQNCTIENNSIIYDSSTYKSDIFAIGLPDRGSVAVPDDGDYKSDQIRVRNNSIYIDSGTASSIAINHYDDGTQHSVVSNLIYYGPNLPATTKCFASKTKPLSAFVAWGNNLCYHAAGGVPGWSDQYSTLANAQASGWDVGSLNVDPMLVAIPSEANGWAMLLKTGSPAINAGHATYSATIDAAGSARGAQPDIGAYEGGH